MDSYDEQAFETMRSQCGQGYQEERNSKKKNYQQVYTHTWSNNCFPVVLGWMANSSSASIVVTRTLI